MGRKARLLAYLVVLGLAAACSGDDGGNDQATDPLGEAFSPSDLLPPDVPALLTVGTHCGVEVISANGSIWRTDEPGAASTLDWIPVEWAESLGQELLVLEVVVSEDRSGLTASLRGRTVTYRPLTPEDGEFFCA